MADEEIFFDSEGREVAKAADPSPAAGSASRRRARAALSMAIAGATDKEIAEQLRFVTPQAARTVWERELAGAYDPTTDYEAMRRLVSARYEALLKSQAPKALNAKIRVPDPAKPGTGETILVDNEEHLQYGAAYRTTLDRIATLHGLNAPQVIKLQSPSQQEFERTIAALVLASGPSDEGEGDIFQEDDEGVFTAEVVEEMADGVQDWRGKLMDQIDTRAPKRERHSVAVNYPPELYALVQEAAKARGMSMASFQRRAVMAFAVHDLGEDWFGVMAEEPNVRPYAQIDGEPEQKAGQGHGAWQIGELHE